MIDTYLLWPFQIGNQTIITRGTTQDEAHECIASGLPRGVTVAFLEELPVNAAQLYTQNHCYGWLHRKPRWMQLRDAA